MNRHVLGIDIGGTNSALGIVNARGEILATGNISTRGHRDFTTFTRALLDETRRICREASLDMPVAIGVGAPSGNIKNGMIERTANLEWPTPLPAAKIMSETFGLPVAVSNDANAAAIGEMTYGAARGLDDFIMITLGTGVGSGVVCDGRLITGREGLAGELGHIIVRRGGRQCGCGRKGCLETYTSATGVVRTIREMLAEKPDEPTALRSIPDAELTSLAAYEAAMAGDALARRVFEFTGTVLGEALADFASFTSPKAFVLFGGLARSGELLLNPLRKAFEENALFFHTGGKVDILLSELPSANAALLGASAIAWQALN